PSPPPSGGAAPQSTRPHISERVERAQRPSSMSSDGEHPTEPAPPGAATAYGTTPAFRPARKEPLLTRTIPVAGELPSYRVSGFRRDLVAGVTVAARARPSAMAYGGLAGLTPG